MPSFVAVFTIIIHHKSAGHIITSLDYQRGGNRVDAQPIGKARQVDQHVADFLADFLALGGIERLALLGGEPLEVLDQFRRFHVSYIANIRTDTEPGSYSSTFTYIATATF